MVNVTVIKGRDVLKFTAKIGIATILLFVFQKILTNFPKQKIEVSSIVQPDDLKSSIEENIPVIKQINGKENQMEEKIGDINPLELLVNNQLNIARHIESKQKDISNKQETEIETTNNEQENNVEQAPTIEVEQAKTGLATQVIPNNVPNKFTNSYHGVQVRNETGYGLTEEMLTPDIAVNNQNILIFHTHTCES